jgi:hypothetical protein
LIIDRVLLDGERLVKKPRRYDTDKFESLFDDGVVIYNRLISSCRRYFIRYINIPDGKIATLVDHAVGYRLDLESVAFEEVYRKVKNWRKNWFQAYIAPAEQIMQELKANGKWENLAVEQLKPLYAGKFCFEYIFQIMTRFDVGMVDWRESLKKKKVHELYKTIYVFTMITSNNILFTEV